MGGALLGVGVLGLEVGRHLGRLLVAQPLVVVGAGPAVVLGVTGRRSATGGCMAGRYAGHGRDASVGAVTRYVDLNADLGEEVTDDAALLAVVTSANVACGYHAGNAGDHARGLRARPPSSGSRSAPRSPTTTARTSAGSPATSPHDVLREQVADQVGTLSAIAAAAGTAVRYVKPHGALYHRVLDDEEQAAAVLDGLRGRCRCSACPACC